MSTPTQQPVAGESTSLIVRTFGQPRFRTDNDIAALAYDTDGRLWSVEEPGVLRSWDDNGRPTGRYFLIDLETSWAFSPQAKLLAAACDELIVWEVATRQMLARIEVPSWVTSIAFHPSQILVATGHDDGVVRLWNPAEEELVAELSEHSLAVSALAFDADGNPIEFARTFVRGDRTRYYVERIVVRSNRPSGIEPTLVAGLRPGQPVGS